MRLNLFILCFLSLPTLAADLTVEQILNCNSVERRDLVDTFTLSKESTINNGVKSVQYCADIVFRDSSGYHVCDSKIDKNSKQVKFQTKKISGNNGNADDTVYIIDFNWVANKDAQLSYVLKDPGERHSRHGNSKMTCR